MQADKRTYRFAAMTTLATRIKQARKHADLTQRALATKVGVEQPVISQLETGKNLQSAHLSKIAHVCGVSAIWLSDGIGPMTNGASSDDGSGKPLEEGSNVSSALQPTRSFSYPEISWVQAGNVREAVDMGNVAMCPQHTSDVWAGEDAFWLRVVGSSMSSASGTSFPEGFLILVAPDIEPRAGQFVVARMTDTNEATFKQLVRDAGELYLKPINPAYPTKAMDETWEIVGTVVDGKMPKSIFL